MRSCVSMLALLALAPAARAVDVSLEAPTTTAQYEVVEFTLRLDPSAGGNPFTDLELTGTFACPGESEVAVRGFVDAQDGSRLKLRFCPQKAPAEYGYRLILTGGAGRHPFEGRFRCESSPAKGPVTVNPARPRHFIHAGSRGPFYHLGYTAYHLMDPSHSDAQIDELIDYCAGEGFNKIRFLLAGYPRDTRRAGQEAGEYGVPNPADAPNYGAPPGTVNPLPAWLGEPHRYDFLRPNVAYWQRIDRAVSRMRRAGIVATCIVTIEKQNLPREYGQLTPAEYLLYRYAVARLAAFDTVWWDLGNEHNEYRDTRWGDTMGAFVKAEDPFDRLLSAHAYAEFPYARSAWADYIITQQYGDEKQVHDWVLKYAQVPRPYINEEYGYEGDGTRNQKGEADAPGHGQSADRTRRSAWSMAMAGGYSTYGDWSGGTSWFYMGRPGPGQAARQLKHLRRLFEGLPYSDMEPHDELTSAGFCLALPPRHYLVYLPRGGTARLDLSGAAEPLSARWYNTREGTWRDGPAVQPAPLAVSAPDERDWVFLIQSHAATRPQ